MTSARVAFTLIGGRQWTGGHTYLVNLLNALSVHEAARVRPVLFAATDAEESDLRPFTQMAGVEIVRSPAFDAARAGARLRSAAIRGIDREAVRLFQAHRIDVVFEPARFYGWRLSIPAIAWLPDFRHRRLRHQFGFFAYWRRELGFRAQVASGRIIMLSSEDARADCERFYPRSVGRTEVVRFSVPLDVQLLEPDPRATADGYGLPSEFYYLPNQFWVHKNHAVVIEALGLMKQQGRNIVVAATGNPLDPGQPDHFASLQRRILELDLTGNFRMLGMVPRSHVLSLLRASAALINPSYFEGWSSTVEEARALGVPQVLSDIPVHREQMGDSAIYFDPNDPADLAAKLYAARRSDGALSRGRGVSDSADVDAARFASRFAHVVDRARAGT